MELEAKYDITNKAKAAGQNALNSARELEQKHEISAKVGSALGKGLDKLSAFLSGACVAARGRHGLTSDAPIRLTAADGKPTAPAAAPRGAMPTSLPSVPR